jgi:quercetin dioxygenase-like cupin family protein
MSHRAIFLLVACTAFGFTAGIFAASGPQMIVTPIEGVEFEPMDPARPAAAQIAVLRGDPASGPSAMLMKFGKGDGRLHVHSSDYDLVVLKGEMKHWQSGETAATAKVLGPGSYWFQPGNQPHADSCLSDHCLMYVQWSGKRDSRAVESARTN